MSAREDVRQTVARAMLHRFDTAPEFDRVEDAFGDYVDAAITALRPHIDAEIAAAVAKERVSVWNEAIAAAANVAARHREMWSCAGGFEGHTSGANVIRQEIEALAKRGDHTKARS